MVTDLLRRFFVGLIHLTDRAFDFQLVRPAAKAKALKRKELTMIKSSRKSQPASGSSEEMLAILEKSGRGDGVLATAYRRAIAERENGIPEPRAFVGAVRPKPDPE